MRASKDAHFCLLSSSFLAALQMLEESSHSTSDSPTPTPSMQIANSAPVKKLEMKDVTEWASPAPPLFSVFKRNDWLPILK